ncbi:MAG: DUF3576 domain-containing protein [Pseudomonadota bacterium]
MARTKLLKNFYFASLCVALASCGGFNSAGSLRGSGGILNRTDGGAAQRTAAAENPLGGTRARVLGESGEGESLFDLFLSPDQNTNVRVNRFLWNASLETLGAFLPVESADPFTGVLVFGWGRAPGSSRQYRATVLVQDPALDARSLKVSVQTRGGTASAETQRRIEDAILTRARQLRIRQNNL